MSDVNQLAAFLQSADTPDPVTDETTGGTDEVETSQEPVEADNYELEAEQDGEAADVEADDESDPEDWYTVKVAGEELQVTLDEALKGYQRDADYRKKTMTLAEERKALDAEKSRISQLISDVDSFIKRESEDVDWDDLRDNDPKEFIRKRDELEKAKEVKAKAEEEQRKQWESIVQKETQQLIEDMGGDSWDSEQRNADLQLASDYLKSKGFGDQDISQMVDHRLWRVVFDAAKAEKFQKTEAKVKESVRKAPKSVKPGQKLPASERQRMQANKEFEKAVKSRNRQSEVSALANLIKNR